MINNFTMLSRDIWCWTALTNIFGKSMFNNATRCMPRLYNSRHFGLNCRTIKLFFLFFFKIMTSIHVTCHLLNT